MAAFPQEDSQGSAGRKSPSRDQIMGEEFTTEMISGSIKEEEGVYPMADQNQEESAKCYSPDEEFTTVIISDSIKEEAYPTADQDTTEFKNALCTAGEEFTKEITSDSIKEEEGAYAMADQNQAELKNFYTPDEEFTTVIISDCIKEEAYPTADQDMKEFKNTLCTAAQSRATGDIAEGEDSQINLEHTNDGESSDGSYQTPIMRRKHTYVPPLDPSEDDIDGTGDASDNRSQIQEVCDSRAQLQPQKRSQRNAARRSLSRSSSGNVEEHTLFAGLEQNVLQVQRLKHKALRSINRQLNTLNKNQRHMGVGIMAMAGAIGKLCAKLQRTESARNRAAERANARMHNYTKAVNRLYATTSNLTRRSITMQMQMTHCCQDIARGLEQVTNAVEQMQTANSGGSTLMVSGESEETSSRSSFTPTLSLTPRRSGRHGAAASHTTEGTEAEQRPAPSRHRRR
ncbi:uncharacterized protein LOC144772344 isoform X2 [Lissotriton helveticus]